MRVKMFVVTSSAYPNKTGFLEDNLFLDDRVNLTLLDISRTTKLTSI